LSEFHFSIAHGCGASLQYNDFAIYVTEMSNWFSSFFTAQLIGFCDLCSDLYSALTPLTGRQEGILLIKSPAQMFNYQKFIFGNLA